MMRRAIRQARNLIVEDQSYVVVKFHHAHRDAHTHGLKRYGIFANTMQAIHQAWGEGRVVALVTKSKVIKYA